MFIFALIFLLLGPFHSLNLFTSASIYYGCRNPKHVALTFDDGVSHTTSKLLDILSEYKVPASFFVLGRNVNSFPGIIARAYKAGHTIGSHSFSHYYLTGLSDDAIVDEMEKTDDAIESVIGVRPKFMRPPYGDIDYRVRNVLDDMGFEIVMWNVDSVDYWFAYNDPWEIVRIIKAAFTERSWRSNAYSWNGMIILQHDIHAESVRMVPEIIKAGRQAGFRFVSLGECLGDDEPYYYLEGRLKTMGPSRGSMYSHAFTPSQLGRYSKDKKVSTKPITMNNDAISIDEAPSTTSTSTSTSTQLATTVGLISTTSTTTTSSSTTTVTATTTTTTSAAEDLAQNITNSTSVEKKKKKKKKKNRRPKPIVDDDTEIDESSILDEYDDTDMLSSSLPRLTISVWMRVALGLMMIVGAVLVLGH